MKDYEVKRYTVAGIDEKRIHDFVLRELTKANSIAPKSLRDFPLELRDMQSMWSNYADKFWVAIVDGEIVGTIGLYEDSDGECYVKRFYVSEPYRKCGIGTTLITVLINEARLLHKQRILCSSRSGITNPYSICRKTGFVKTWETYNTVRFVLPLREGVSLSWPE